MKLFRTFVAVARHGSLSAASEQVALTPAAVSLQMRALEEEMNQSLFDREGHVVTLNERGHQLLPGIEQILKLYEDLRHEGMDDGEPAGTLNVGATGSTIELLANVALKMRKHYPKLIMNLNMGYASDLSQRVAQGELDAAVSVKGQRKLHPGILWTALYDEPFVFIKSRSAGHYKSMQEELAKQPFVRPARLTRTGMMVDQLIRKHRLQVNEFMELNSLRTLISLVQRGMGVSIVPLRLDAIQQSDPLLHVIPFPGEQMRRSIGLFENEKHARLTSVLRKLLRDEVSARSQRASS